MLFICIGKSMQRNRRDKIGMTLNCDWTTPLTDRAEDIAAAERAVEFQLGWFADPIYFGDYPASMKLLVGDRLPRFSDSEKELLRGSHDFFGLNHYSTSYAYAWNDSQTKGDSDVPLSIHVASQRGWQWDRDLKTTFVGTDGKLIGPLADSSSWLAVVPWGIGKLLRWVHTRYAEPPIYITENGVDVPGESAMSLDDALHDKFRIDYYRSYLRFVLDAMQEGVNVQGYMAWSFLDNFEWTDGYSKRFGLVYVDYKHDLRRHRKASARWFTQLVRRKTRL